MPEWVPGNGLDGATIVLGVTGGIAAYKAADLTSKLVQAGADVHVCLSDGALEFIRPMTFQALTRNPVYSSVFDGWEGDSAGHVTLAKNANAVIIAPATANSIAKMVEGRAEDMLQTVLLSTQAPIIVAPAMEHHMWHHPATQANVATLRERGVTIVEPETGHLASGAEGDGRLASMDRLVGALRQVLGRSGPLAGSHVVVTAGGTHEAIDPVRFIGNGSSGQMGKAIADAALDAGADVTLIAGPTVSTLPQGAEIVRVTSAREMEAAVHAELKPGDILVMAAAVADFRPANASDHKIKKQPGQEGMSLDLVRNPDIIAGVDGEAIFKVGFAAETDDLLANAATKLKNKGLRMIVANDAVATIGSDSVRGTLLFADGREPMSLDAMPKSAFATHVVEQIIALREGTSAW